MKLSVVVVVVVASISCGFWFDRILISEALFTFPVKRFMQEFDDFE